MFFNLHFKKKKMYPEKNEYKLRPNSYSCWLRRSFDPCSNGAQVQIKSSIIVISSSAHHVQFWWILSNNYETLPLGMSMS